MKRRPVPSKGVSTPESPSRRAPAVGAPSDLRAWRLDVCGEAFALLETSAGTAAHAFGATLSGAERAVARLVVEGLSNLEIARRRGAAPRTVANQVASVFRKLGVGSRAQLCALAAGAPWEEGPG